MKLENKYKGNSDIIKWKFLLERPENFKEGKPTEMIWDLLQELCELERRLSKYLCEFKQGPPHPYTFQQMRHRFEKVRETLDKSWKGCFASEEADPDSAVYEDKYGIGYN